MERKRTLDDTGIRERIFKKVQQAAERCNMQFHGCARCTLYGIRQFSGIRIDDSLIKGVAGLSGGAGRDTYSCGAYIAGVIAIGLCYGPLSIECSDESIHSDVNRFRNLFVKEFGSTICRNIQKSKFGEFYNLTDLNEREKFMAIEPSPWEKCSNVIGGAARMAVEIIMTKTEWQPPCIPI